MNWKAWLNAMWCSQSSMSGKAKAVLRKGYCESPPPMKPPIFQPPASLT